MQPTIGPIQRAASADDDPNDNLRTDCANPKNRRAYKGPTIGEKAAGETGERAANGEGRELVGAGIVSQKLGAPFIFPDADNDAAEPAGQQQRP